MFNLQEVILEMRVKKKIAWQWKSRQKKKQRKKEEKSTSMRHPFLKILPQVGKLRSRGDGTGSTETKPPSNTELLFLFPPRTCYFWFFFLLFSRGSFHHCYLDFSRLQELRKCLCISFLGFVDAHS